MLEVELVETGAHTLALKHTYTLGPGLRIPIIKNMGKALALEELRICPMAQGAALVTP